MSNDNTLIHVLQHSKNVSIKNYINLAFSTAFKNNFCRSVENLHMAQLNPSAHRASCGGFSLCGGNPPVNVCHDSAHLLHTSSAAGPAAAAHVHGAAGHHSAASADGKRRISTCSGYSTATGKDPLPQLVSKCSLWPNLIKLLGAYLGA